MESVLKKKKLVKFAPKGSDSFYDAMKKAVDDYFVNNNISQHANGAMKVKTATMLAIYFLPLVAIITGLASASTVLFYGLWLLMGVGIVGIGTCVMHDSNHGAYSSNKGINLFLGNLLNLIGGYSRNWRIQHNVLHHTYTNVEGLDEDIDGTILLRMSPNRPLLGIHRYQHIYSWFLYLLMNLFWVTVKDYTMIVRYNREDLLKKEKITMRKALIEVTAIKLGYFFVTLGLPLLFSAMPWYHVLAGFVMMHMVAGLALACIFQPAHVMETSSFSMPTADLKMEDNWATHQLLNTTNFAPGSKITSWFMGGLNYQIEHHLFPHVCHIHYPKISGIVKAVAEKYGVPYNVQPTVMRALLEHGRMLKNLGRPVPVRA